MVDRNLWQLAALVGCAVSVAVGVFVGLGYLVWTDRLPLWLHHAVEFIGWWLIGALIMAFIWALIMRNERKRRDARAAGVGQRAH